MTWKISFQRDLYYACMIPAAQNWRGFCLVQSSTPFHIVQASPDLSSFFEYDLDDSHGRSLELVHSPERGNTRYEDAIKASKSGKEQESELNVDKKYGSRIRTPVKVSMLPALEVAVSLDVTSKKATTTHSFVHVDDGYYDSPALPDVFRNALNIEAQHRLCMQQKTQIAHEASSNITSKQLPASATCKSAEEATDKLRCLLSRASCQICKALLASEKDMKAFNAAHPTTAAVTAPPPPLGMGDMPLELIARCARQALVSIRSACDDGGGGLDGARAAMALRLVEAEVLPQAGRWHRRDLAPMLEATWRAVFRALRRL